MTQAIQRLTTIVVGYTDYGESDRIVQLLSAELGVISAMARGARASKKRFGGAIDLGNRLEVLLKPGQGELWKLNEAKILEGRLHIRSNLHKIAVMSYLCEVCSTLAQQEQPEKKLFTLLEVALDLLSQNQDGYGRRFRQAFEAKALVFAGLHPQLLRCISCNEALHESQDSQYCFVPAEGGVFHRSCAESYSFEGPRPAIHHCSLTWLRELNLSLRTPLVESISVKMPDGPQWVLADVMENHSGKALRSRDFLRSLERL